MLEPVIVLLKVAIGCRSRVGSAVYEVERTQQSTKTPQIEKSRQTVPIGFPLVNETSAPAGSSPADPIT